MVSCNGKEKKKKQNSFPNAYRIPVVLKYRITEARVPAY